MGMEKEKGWRSARGRRDKGVREKEGESCVILLTISSVVCLFVCWLLGFHRKLVRLVAMLMGKFGSVWTVRNLKSEPSIIKYAIGFL